MFELTTLDDLVKDWAMFFTAEEIFIVRARRRMPGRDVAAILGCSVSRVNTIDRRLRDTIRENPSYDPDEAHWSEEDTSVLRLLMLSLALYDKTEDLDEASVIFKDKVRPVMKMLGLKHTYSADKNELRMMIIDRRCTLNDPWFKTPTSDQIQRERDYVARDRLTVQLKRRVETAVSAIKELAPLKSSGQWSVDADGLYCNERDYFISKDRLSENWLDHLSKKDWVDVEEFAHKLALARILTDADLSAPAEHKCPNRASYMAYIDRHRPTKI